ncbi:uncharacterized protein [Amphiura filiformis]|uniref:uncharacterized protein n=1 Tax=Amphiura filiformis TaxID=82378 RepID=UPI003B20E031
MAEPDKNESVSDEPEGEDPTTAAYRNLILQMDQMENGENNEEHGTKDVKPVAEDRAPLLLSTLQEEDELQGSDGPRGTTPPQVGGRLSTPPPQGLRLSTPPPGGRLTTPPPNGIPSSDITANLLKLDFVKSRTSLEDGRASPIQGRTSPLTGGGRTSPVSSGRSSPMLHRGRVSPSPLAVTDEGNAKDCYEKLQKERKVSVHSIQVLPAPKLGSEDEVKQTQNGTLHHKGPTKETGNGVEAKAVHKMEKRKESLIFIRAFEDRASQENFALYGLLTPALCVVPNVDGCDTLTQTFTGLQGQDRELKLAAAHIDDAINGRGKYGKARAFFTSKRGQFCFKVQNNRWFNYLVLIATVIHMLLIFFEPPPTGSTRWFIFALTPICLLIYTADVAVYIGFLSWKVFWTLDENKFIRAEFILLCMYTLDFLMLVIQEILNMRLFQVFRVLRAAIIICKLKNVGHIFDVVMSIVIKLGKVFLIVILFIMMFSAVGVHLLEDDYHQIASNSNCTDTADTTYVGAFDHLGIASLRLFVLLTTENYPDLMTQAFSVDKLSAFYFIIYILIGVFFLTAILLAIVVDSYWEFAKKHVKKERARERAELAKAWNLLDPLGHGSLEIDDEKLIKLFKILRPQNTDDMNMQLIQYLDDNGDGHVDSLEWTIRLNDALGFEFEMEDNYISGDHRKWVSSIKKAAQKVAFSNIFNLFILILLFIHCILFCLHWYNMRLDAELAIQVFKTVIVTIFMLEVLFRIVSDWRVSLLQVIEVFDLALIVVAFVFNIVWYFYMDNHLRNWFSVVSGLAVAFRVGLNSNETKRVVVLFSTKIFPVMFDLIILVFIIVYFYAVLGFELFYNKTPATNHSSPYCGCGLGFDTFWCSMLAVFQIVTTSNWHDLMNSAMVSTNDWACLYFVTCYVAINLVVMNLFVAIAIEAFNKLGTEKETEAAQITEDLSRTRRESMVDSAKTFLNNLFESSRQKEPPINTAKQGQGPPSPRMRKMSRAMSIAGLTPMPPLPNISNINSVSLVDMEEEEEEEENEEDYSGLTPQERKKKQRKKKMQDKKKKKIPKTKIVVVTAYRGTKDQELDLNVGDEVTVLQKKVKVVKRQDDWWEGTIRGKRGWFPGSHVREVKKNVLSPQTQRKDVEQNGTDRPKSPGPKPAWSSEKKNVSFASAEPQPPAIDPHAHHLTMQEVASASKHKPKLKLKNTGSWRKEILGDITVINPEELKELSKILKSRTPHGSLNSSIGASGTMKRRPTTLTEKIIEEEEEPEAPAPVVQPKPVLVTPKINLERVPTMDLPEEDVEEDSNGTIACPFIEVELNDPNSSDTLTVEKPELPSELKKKKNKENSTDGEMPSWMKKFVETNKINVSSDVKVDETRIPDLKITSDEDTQTFQDGKQGKEKEEQVTEL